MRAVWLGPIARRLPRRRKAPRDRGWARGYSPKMCIRDRAQAFASQGASRSVRRAIQGQPGQVQTFAGERVSRPLSFDEGEFLVDGYGAYAPYDRATEQYAAEDLLLGGGSNETADDASSHEKVSSAQLEGMFQEFFRMGAAVAIGELYDEGMLGDKNAVAYDVRDYLESFGIASFDEVCRLGITGPYLEAVSYTHLDKQSNNRFCRQGT